MRLKPALKVVQWLDAQADHVLFTSAITHAEIELGLALLEPSKRRKALEVQATLMFEQDFAQRCLPFTSQCAAFYGELMAAQTRQGRPMSVEDAQIAAVCLANQKILVTRNTVDFERVEGLKLVNPWN